MKGKRTCDADDCEVQFTPRAAHHRFHDSRCKDRERRRQKRLAKEYRAQEKLPPREVKARTRNVPTVESFSDHPDRIRVMIVNDTQFPYIDYKLWDAVCWIAEKRDLDGVIWNGDMLDFTQLSSFDFNPYNQQSAVTDVAQFNDWVREPFRQAADAEWEVWLDGNHENRVIRSLVKKAPGFLHDNMMRDFLELPDSMEYVPYGKNTGWFLADDLLVSHGWAARKHSAYTAKAHVEDAGMSVMHGHTHRLGSYWKTTPSGVVMGQELGHMTVASTVPGHHDGGTADWQQNAGTLVVLDPDTGAWYHMVSPVVGRDGDRKVLVPDLDVELAID